MTRTTDTPGQHARTSTGRATGWSPIATSSPSRIEVANAARADVFIVLHNNGTPPGVGGDGDLVRLDPTVLGDQPDAGDLSPGQPHAVPQDPPTASWSPKNRGIKAQAPFYVLRSYQPAFADRPEPDARHPRRVAVDGPPLRAPPARERRGTPGHRRGLLRGPRPVLRHPRLGAPATTLLAGPGASAVEGTTGSPRSGSPTPRRRRGLAGAVSITLSAVNWVPWYDGSNAPGTRLATVPLPGPRAGRVRGPRRAVHGPGYASVAATAGRTLLKVDLVAGRTVSPRPGSRRCR